MTEAVRLVESFEPLIERYTGFIFDVWGTLYDGADAYPAAIKVLDRLADAGKSVAILSNSPQRPAVVETRLNKLGIDRRHYQSLVTSGGETHWHLKTRPNAFYRDLGLRVFETGPIRFPNLLHETPFTAVSCIDDADVILNSGPENQNAVVADFTDLLTRAKARELPMICANPDLEVYVGDSVQVCAGSIAAAYEAINGQVFYHGKPQTSVFQTCLNDLNVRADECLMVGDNIRTDVTGAKALGMPALWLADGIDRRALIDKGTVRLDKAMAMAANHDLSGLYVMPRLS